MPRTLIRSAAALLAASTVAGAADAQARTPLPAFVVTKGHAVTRSVRAAPPTARVELRVAPRSGRRALLSVRSSGTARWSIPVARSRVLRLPMPVRNGRVRIRFRARRGSVRVQVRRVSSASPKRSATPQPAPAPAPVPGPSPPTPASATPQPQAPSFGTLVFADEFDGPAGAAPDPARWTHEVGGGGWGNNELESYTDRTSNAHLDGQGALDIVARRESYTDGAGVTRDYTSARINTKGHYAVRYGRIEARMMTPAGTGLWPAFWTMGDDLWDVGWPQSGELDVMEQIGSEPSRVSGHLHGPLGTAGDSWSLAAGADAPGALTGSFHTYGVVWWPDGVEWTLDGVPYGHVSRADVPPGGQWVFDKPQFLILNLAVGGNWPGAPAPDTAFPATLKVDWVRVYQ